MSQRGAGSGERLGREREFVHAEKQHVDVVLAAVRTLRRSGLDAGEAATLMANAAAGLAQLDGGFERDEWVDLTTDLWDELAFEADENVTAPGGIA